MFDCIRFLNDFGIEWISKGANVGRGWVGVNDPFTTDSGFHGGFNIHGGYFYSWKTGGHSTFETVKAFTGRQDHEVYRILDEYSARRTILEHLNERKNYVSALTLPGTPLDGMCRKYLRKRKFDPDEVEQKYTLRSGGIVGSFAFRIIIPVYYKKRLISWIGRDVTNKQEIRYKNLPIEMSVMDVKSVLYNLDNCKNKSIVVMEGAFDVMRWGDNSCATLGTTVTDAQVMLLKEYEKVYIMFDNDEAGIKKAKTTAERIAVMGVDVEIVNHGFDHDIGSATKEEVDYLKKELA